MNFDDVNDGEAVKGDMTDQGPLPAEDFRVPMKPCHANKAQGDEAKIDLALREELNTEVMAVPDQCSLQSAVAIKKSGAWRPIGFLQAA